VSIPFFFRNAIRSTIGRFRHKPSDGVSEITAEDSGATPTDAE
jgi:hypothetical protein